MHQTYQKDQRNLPLYAKVKICELKKKKGTKTAKDSSVLQVAKCPAKRKYIFSLLQVQQLNVFIMNTILKLFGKSL